MLLTFSPTQAAFNLTVMIVSDDILENTETFTVQAELVSADAASSVMIAPPQSEVTILDDDGEFVCRTSGQQTSQPD
jgi:hypothetical protein